jgi:hypothetical protein
MASRKRTLLLMLLIFVGWTLLALIFAVLGVHKIGSSPIFPVAVVVLTFFPLYPLYRLAVQWPRFRLGLVSAMAGLLASAVAAIAHYFLRIDEPWVDLLLTLGEILFFISSVLLAWQGLRSRA